MEEEWGRSSSHERREKSLEDAIVALVILFIVLKLFAMLPTFLSNNLGVDPSFFSNTFGIEQRLDANTPLGTAVKNTDETTLYSEPGGGEILGTQPKGAKGKIIGGPVLRDGKLWWKVEYEDGSVGWVDSDDLAVDSERDKLYLKENSPPGTKVENVKDTNVYSSPYDDALVVGTARKGDKGVIIGGPVERDGERWWQVRYEDGTSGWVPESALQIDVERNQKGLNDNTPLGTKVVAPNGAKVWSSPNGGELIGEQPRGAKGRVIDGPVTVGTQRWWKVEFEDGTVGWVLEEDLERVNPIRDAGSSSFAFLKKLSYTISIILLAAVLYVFSQLRQENSKEYHRFKSLSTVPEEQIVKNNRWDRIIDHLDSDNPNDWRLAVLEADIVLDEIVETMYLPGDTLGERLKSVEISDFNTIDKAWEAHKVRNKLAHEGGDFILTQREAKRIVGLYEEVFKEFHAI